MDACLFQGSWSAKKFFLGAALPMLRLCLPAAAQYLPASFARLIYFLFISSLRRSQASTSTRSCPAVQMSENLSCSKRGGSSPPVAERSNSCVKKRFLSSSHGPRKEQPFKRSAFCSFLGIHWKTKIALAGICRAALGCCCRRLPCWMSAISQSCAAER